MNTQLYQFILDQKHHRYRQHISWNLGEEYAQKGLSPKERIADRFSRLCQQEQAIILEGEQIVFLRTAENIPDVFTPEEWADIREKHCLTESGYLANLSPDYYTAIGTGLLKFREKADCFIQRTIDSIFLLSDKYLAEARRQGRDDLVEVLTQVPRHPARNFREALQFFRILHFSLWLEGSYHNTVGRFDKEIYPYLKADLEQGLLTEASALELLEDFFLSFNKDSDLYPGVQQGDNGQSMMLGGIDETGADCFNLLSSLCMKASYNNRLIDPKINLRVSRNTPQAIFTEAAELAKAGLGFPQYSNDDVVIPALESLGYEPQDARNYTVAACWEFIIPKYSVEGINVASLSYPREVDIALHSALLGASSYEEFFDAVAQQIRNRCDEVCRNATNIWFAPSHILNMLMDCEVNEGGKYNNFGIHGTGLSTAADSLAAIKRYIFEAHSITKEDLIRAVDENFENDPQLLHLLRYEAPKLGNNDPFVDDIATALMTTFADALKGKVNCRGGCYRAGTGSAMNYIWQADEIGASADGRRAGEPFAANHSVSLFAKAKGPVSIIASMTKQPFAKAINGGPLTLEFGQSVFAGADGPEKVGLLVKSFIQRGGHQLQLNTASREAMLDAQRHPQRYRQLVVRVWGWSAYFVELDKEYQDHVIARQVHRL